MPTFKFKNASGTVTSVTLYESRLTTPSLAVQYNNKTYYASVIHIVGGQSNGNLTKLKFKWAGTIYNVQGKRTTKTLTFVKTTAGTAQGAIGALVPGAWGDNIKITSIVGVGGGAGGGGGGGSAYNAVHGASGATGTAGSCGSHFNYTTAISISSVDNIKIVVGSAGSGGAGGKMKGVTSYNSSAYMGAYGTAGSAGGNTTITIAGTKLLYAMGGTGGGGGEGGKVQGNTITDGTNSNANKKASAPSTSGLTVLASANNKVNATVARSASNVLNADANTLIGSNVGTGGAGGTGGQKLSSGTGTHKIGNDGSTGSNGLAGAVKMTVTCFN